MVPHFNCIGLAGDDFGVVLIPRCASRSMEIALRPNWIIEEKLRRIGFIRDPVDRLKSFFNLNKSTKKWKRYDFAESPGSLVRYVLSGGSDRHIRPQSLANVTEWYLFENISDVFRELYPMANMIHWGRTRRRDSYPELESDEIREFYQDDFRIREELKSKWQYQ